MIDEILAYNRRFVAEKGYERFITDKYPNKRIAIVTCMDTRLVELLPAALGLRNGDVKIIKNAGGTITNPFDSTVRSLLVAIYELGVNEVMIIGHTNCGVQGMDSAEMQHLMKQRGIPEHHISLMKHCGIDLDQWLHGFDDTEAAVLETVDLVRNHPLVPGDIVVKGYIMDSTTGELRPIQEPEAAQKEGGQTGWKPVKPGRLTSSAVISAWSGDPTPDQRPASGPSPRNRQRIRSLAASRQD